MVLVPGHLLVSPSPVSDLLGLCHPLMLVCMMTGIGAGPIPGPNALPFILWSHSLSAAARHAGTDHKKDCAITTANLRPHSDWSMFLYIFPWWMTREETDWGLKTHQVFNRWLSEKDFQITCQHNSLLQHSAHCLHDGSWIQRKARGKVVGSAS